MIESPQNNMVSLSNEKSGKYKITFYNDNETKHGDCIPTEIFFCLSPIVILFCHILLHT